VRITLSEHRADLAFAVSGPEAKAAIQQALPQLRELLAETGLQLGDATFGDHRPEDQGDTAGGDMHARGDRAATAAAPVALRPAAAGLVDTYA
jgi:flagellar hook-length control protein FliK